MNIRLNMKKDKNTITSPTNAATIVFLAFSTPVLSPPDVIHLIPPQIRNAKAMIAAITKAAVIILPTSPPPRFNLQRMSKPTPPPCASSGHGSTFVSAKAGRARERYVAAENPMADNFFIINMIVGCFFLLVKGQMQFAPQTLSAIEWVKHQKYYLHLDLRSTTGPFLQVAEPQQFVPRLPPHRSPLAIHSLSLVERLGSFKSCIFLSPKKPNKKFIMKKDKNTITSPTNAATIVFLAFSTPVLSPPDVIHLIPPQIRNAKAMIAAITKAAVIILPTSPPPRFNLQRMSKPTPPPCASSGHGSTFVSAKAGRARERYVAAENPMADNFFITDMTDMIVGFFLAIVNGFYLISFIPKKAPIIFIMKKARNEITSPIIA